MITLTVAVIRTGFLVAFSVLNGQTLGMMFLGFRVVYNDGRLISLIQRLLHFLGDKVLLLALFLGHVWMLIDDRRNGWQDRFVFSFMVQAWDAIPDESFMDITIAQRCQGEVFASRSIICLEVIGSAR